MTRYQPKNPTTGETGPDTFDTMTAACLWVLAHHPNERGWTVVPVRAVFGVLHVTNADRASWANVEA